MDRINKTALKNSVLTTLYIVGVGNFIYWGGQMKLGRENLFLVPIALLLLFVCSAAITGYLIFGKPVQIYLDGKKKEAMSLLTHTILYFAVITFTALTSLIFFTR